MIDNLGESRKRGDKDFERGQTLLNDANTVWRKLNDLLFRIFLRKVIELLIKKEEEKKKKRYLPR